MTMATSYHRDAHLGTTPIPAHSLRHTLWPQVRGLLLDWLRKEAEAGHPEALVDHMFLWQQGLDCGGRVWNSRTELALAVERCVPHLHALRTAANLYGVSEESSAVILDYRADVWAANIWADDAAAARLP